MTLEEFKKSVEIISPDQKVRNKYIDSFINKESDFFIKTISCYKQFSDGLCYEGYLWDCLKGPYTVVTFKQVQDCLHNLTKLIAFWDVHSKDRILVPNLWKFPKDAVLSLSAKSLLQGFEFLPEDLYICDETFRWTLILTHEEDYKRNERICVAKGEILP